MVRPRIIMCIHHEYIKKQRTPAAKLSNLGNHVLKKIIPWSLQYVDKPAIIMYKAWRIEYKGVIELSHNKCII